MAPKPFTNHAGIKTAYLVLTPGIGRLWRRFLPGVAVFVGFPWRWRSGLPRRWNWRIAGPPDKKAFRGGNVSFVNCSACNPELKPNRLYRKKDNYYRLDLRK